MSSKPDRTERPIPLPDAGDIIFLIILFFLLFSVPNFVFGDGSTGWHLVTGEHVVKTSSIPRTDLISYTFPDSPWVAYQWLADVIMYLFASWTGLNGLALAVSAAISLLFLLLYERSRRAGCHFLLSVMLTVVGAVASSLHWLARPQIFTLFGVYVFVALLESHRRGITSGARLVAASALIMILWANLHPAFILGFVLIGIYLVSDSLGFLLFPALAPELGKRAKWLIAAGCGGLAASFINPYGPGLLAYIFRYLQGIAVLEQTAEYESPIFHGQLQSTCFEALLLLLAVGLVLSRKRPALPQFISCVTFAALGLAAVRNIPLFVVVALPVVAELLANARLLPAGEAAAEPAAWWNRLGERWQRLGREFDATERRCTMHILPAAAVFVLAIAAANGGSLLGLPLLNSGFDPQNMPTGTLECLRRRNLNPTAGFNFDNWGGYIRYKTGIPVFIDDRADFYGQRFYLEYGTVSTVSPGWRDVLERHKIEWILFPKDSRLAARLKEEPGWKLVCQDAAAELFVRAPPTR
ncbi:MAG TPA: hypothetical protein V6D08_03705 [Candidatus Obscuribacterales bacterium]